MNRSSTLVGIVSGLFGAGCVYILKSKDTIVNEGEPKSLEANSNILNPKIRLSDNNLKNFETAVKKSQELVKRFKDEIGVPGLIIGVSVDGNTVWEEGFGYANLETRTPCNVNTAMRIASISKPITMALLGKLYEEKKVDLDRSVHDYVPYFPKKKIDNEEVDITIRQLASHTAGVRHYKKKGEKKEKGNRDSGKEFYYKQEVNTIEKSVEMFKDDELLFKPGTSFEYTTHGYTLLSAVIENVGKKPFTFQIEEFFKSLALKNTYLDRVPKIIYERSSYYDKNENGHIVNAKLADTSYKWAGGGFVSTVGDLLKFGNIMLYSYQQQESDKPGYLKSETVKEMWTSVENTVMKWGKNSGYGLGWTVVPEIEEIGGVNENQRFHVGHSGGAVGASSVLIIIPDKVTNTIDKNKNLIRTIPKGIVVAVLVNLENVSCKNLGKSVANEFNKL